MNIEIVPIIRKLNECRYGDIVKFVPSDGKTHTCLVMYQGMVSFNDPESTWTYSSQGEENIVGNYEVELVGQLKLSS
jgi:hypothetical protein